MAESASSTCGFPNFSAKWQTRVLSHLFGDPFPTDVVAHVLLKTGPNISTDDIIPALTRVMPYWSNIPKVSQFTFEAIDDTYASRATQHRDHGQNHAIIGGPNYGPRKRRDRTKISRRPNRDRAKLRAYPLAEPELTRESSAITVG